MYLKYQKDLPFALENLNFTIKKGRKVGIIGRTGAGKSSILQVLFRVVDPEFGTIFIDGQDYMKADIRELRRQMSVIPQTPCIFQGTIRENLDPMGNATDVQIYFALSKVNLLDRIHSL